MTGFRTPAGGRIDRSRPLRFTFDGRSLTGFAGDTLASALIANGIHLAGRSFKYHRPRGILGAGSEEPNALVTVDRGGGRETPNLRATTVELFDGLAAISQNRWPSLDTDFGAVADLFSPFLSAGFYYKTFMWPRSFWARLYEPVIRRSAGLGRAPKAADPDRYLQRYAHCDVLVVGAGPAGLAAAHAAGRAGARVIVCDEQAELGGSLLHERSATLDREKAADWLAGIVGELADMKSVRLLPRTTAFGYFAQNFLGLAERVTDHLATPDPLTPRERLWQVRAKEVVLATGAIERPLVFQDNDRPGIMLAEAARIYVNRYGAKPGSRAVVATTDDSAYRVAADLAEAGIAIAAIVDVRPSPGPEALALAESAGARVLAGATVIGTAGRRRIASADIGPLGASHPTERIACDLLLMSGGWTPSVHLFSQSRGRLRYSDRLDAYVPDVAVERQRSVGGCAGILDLAGALQDGVIAGSSASADAATGRPAAALPIAAATAGAQGAAEPVPTPPAAALPTVARELHGGAATRLSGDFDDWRKPRPLDPNRIRQSRTAAAMAAPAPSAPPARRAVPVQLARKEGGETSDPPLDKAFVDFQNDVTVKDLKLAMREGFRSIEHIKRYTTTGMATDQGKTSNINALHIVADAQAKPVPAVGITTFRQPYTPVTFGAIAGASRGVLFDPVRLTPSHDWAVKQGAVFEDVGLWKRARYFPREREDMHQAVARECRLVRRSVGLFDASTLGKIEVAGPDAAEFMNRMYTNPWGKLEAGRCRYGLLLNEAGFVIDDGVVGRLAFDRFHVTTTTGGAPRVLNHMEDYLQTEFTDLDVWLTSTTEQWAVIAVQGPKAREVIAPLTEGIDVSNAAMPHMSVRTGKVCSVPARLFRVSFTGELGFEINVPARYGAAVWEMVYAAGKPFDMVPYGTEAMHVLRAEKGYIIVGQETDGTVIPEDLGLGWAVGKQKPDFVGKRSLTRPDMLKSDRKQLVGLFTTDPKIVLEEGAQVTAEPDAPIPAPMLGHVTSSYWSETLYRSIALALVVAGHQRRGERLYVRQNDQAIEVEVVDPVFLDKEGARLDA